jgi:hypothetical protein
MKTKIILIVWLSLALSSNLWAQGSSQTFASQGFRVSCGCSLYVNSVFIQAAKQQGANNILAAYICAENKDSPETGVIANINIYDESASYKTIKPIYHDYFEKKCLEKYAVNLSNAGYSYQYITYQGVSALEYNFDQMGVPTKAILFYKNKKSYLLQVATRTGLATKFNSLKSSFELL